MKYPKTYNSKQVKCLSLLVLFFIIQICSAQEAPSWVDFCAKSKSGEMTNSVLLDYSYAGYHFSEKVLPDLSAWNQISVVDYGATPNDGSYDDAGIQAAIIAAESASVPTVVYFPAGKYIISSEATADKSIRVSKSYIVLKGAGSDDGGTEIYCEHHGDVSKKYNTTWQFNFEPSTGSSSKIAKLTKAAQRGDYTIEVDNGSSFKVGMLVQFDHYGVANLAVNLPGLKYSPKWTYTNSKGMRMIEKHIVTKVEGTKITFKNPINFNVPLTGVYANIKRYSPIEEIGVEDILFTSGWKECPQVYAHHANDTVDYAWRALRFEKAYNSWIRNVKFRDWNDCIQIRSSFAMTVKDVEISGKQGHASYMAMGSTGILFENCKDFVPVGFNNAGGQGHGPAFQYYSTGCVYTNILMQKHQSVDCHGNPPYGNLFDNVSGGCFRGNGASESNYPNSGPDLVFWNFVHASNYTTKQFSFWDTEKRYLHMYAYPKFIGFTSPGEKITFKNQGLDELHGKMVYPKSLFWAQLQMRLYGVYASASSEMTDCEAKNVVDGKADNYWSPSSHAVGAYLVLDLGTEQLVNGISLIEIDPVIKTFKVECWVDGQWKAYETTLSGDDENTWTMDTSITTRKVRLTIEDLRTDTQVKISAFSITYDSSASIPGSQASSEELNLSILPNPNNGVFSIKLNSNASAFYSVYSLNGTLQTSGGMLQKQQVQLNACPSGVYLVKVESKELSTIKRVIIQ